jgi:hypothetical protein
MCNECINICRRGGGGNCQSQTVNEYTKTHQFDGAMAVLNHLGEPNNKPFTMLSGEHTEHSYVGIDYLQELYAKNY